MRDHQDLRNDFHWAVKIKQPAWKILRVRTKNEENFGKIQENVDIFNQNLYGKVTWSSASSLKVYTSGR